MKRTGIPYCSLYPIVITIFLVITIIGFAPLHNIAAAAKTNESSKSSQQEISPTKPDVTIRVTSTDIPIKDIHYGNFSEIIKNPRCICFAELLSNNPHYQEIQKKKIKQSAPKYWIELATANEMILKQIDAYAKTANIEIICERKTLLAALKKQEAFKGKNDEELIKEFDVTQAIIEFGKKQEKSIIKIDPYLLK